MATRFARTFINTTSRTSLRPNAARIVVGRRLMSSSHGHATGASSDKPWAIASALIFGPMFLYLVSPSSRKNFHGIHNDAHDYPGYHPPQSQQVIMKDSEGTPADVTESIKKAEIEDVPKAEPAQVVTPEASPAAEPQSVSEVNAGIAAEDSKPSTSQTADAPATPAQTEETPAAAENATLAPEKPNTQQKDEKPTDVGAAREAAVEHAPPKEQTAKEA